MPPQDNLTREFQKELERRGVQTSLSVIEDILREEGLDPQAVQVPTAQARAGGEQEDLWQALQTGQMPDWFESKAGDWGYDATWGALVGKSLWSFVETAGLGVPGFVARTIDEQLFPGGRKWEEIAAPKTTAERWTGAITGVAGFIPPFGWARGIASAALKGARVVKGGKVVGYGTSVAGKKFTDNTVRILKKDKEFLKWASSKGMGPDDIERFIKESALVTRGVQAITKVGTRKGAKAFSNHSIRTQYAKQVDENIPKIIQSEINKIAKFQPGFTVNERAQRLIADEVRKYIGGKYNMPITNLHQYWALRFGNRRMASLAASAAEEAILFTAVEIPMSFMNSLNNEDIDFNILKTMGHSIALGSALGLVRLIPGGTDAGILKTGFKRMNQYLSRRKRWSQYNVNNEADRMLLVKHAEHLWEANDDIFSLLVKSDKGLKTLLRDKKDLASFAKDATSATELKKWMGSLEGAFLRQFWPDFARNAGRDILGSSGRMLAGSMAFNVGTMIAYANEELPFEDLIFHTLLGAVLSKKGRDIEYRNEHGDLVMLPGTKRPMFYDTKFEKVNKYLDMLGMNLDHAAFKNIMNNMEVIKKYGTPDLSHDDIIKLKEIGEDSKLFIAVDKEPTLKKKDVVGNPLYETYKAILEATIENPEVTRVKSIDELSSKELADLTTKLRNTRFKSLDEYRTVKSTQKGVATPFDLNDILHAAASPGLKNSMDIYESAVREAYNIIYEMEWRANGERGELPIVKIDENGRMVLRPISFENSSLPQNADRLGGLFGGIEDKNSALGLIRGRVVIAGQPIVFNGEMSKKLFGEIGTDNFGEVDKFDRQYHESITGNTEVEPADIIRLGDKTFNDALRRNLFIDNVVKLWKEMLFVRDRDVASIFGDEVGAVKDLLSIITGTGKPYLPSSLIVRDANKVRLSADSPEQKFITNLLSLLQSDIKYGVERTELGVAAEPRYAKETDVIKLMDYFDRYGLLEGFKGDRADVELFIKKLSDYTFEKSLGNATRRDGTPLTDKDFSVLKVLVETRLAGRNFNMARLSDYAGNIREKLIRSDITTKTDVNDINRDVTFWVNRNYDKVDKVFSELEASKEKSDNTLYKAFNDVVKIAREEGHTDQSIAHMVWDYLTLYEKTLEPLWRDSKGNGVLQESSFDAKPTQDFMFKIVSHFEAIQSGAIRDSYDRLLNSVYQTYDNTKTVQHKEFLVSVLNSLVNKMGNTTRVLEVMKNYNLYRGDDGTFLLDSGEKDLSQRIKEASYQMKLLTQPLNTSRSIELMMERDKLDFLPKQDSDLTTSVTFDKLITDWGIELPEIGDVKPQDYVLKNVYDAHGDFTFDHFFDYMLSNMTVKKIDNVSYSKSNWKEMPSFEKKKMASDMQKVWLSLAQTKEVTSLKVAQGAIPLAKPETTRRNIVTDELEDLFSELVFIDLKYRLDSGTTYDITHVSDQVLGRFLNDVAEVGQRIEARKTLEEPYVGPLTQQSGYITAFLGDLDYGIGIPLHPYQGELIGQHKLANRFVERLKSVEDRFTEPSRPAKGAPSQEHADYRELVSRNRSIREAARGMLDKYVESDGTRIVEKRETDVEGEPHYIFRSPVAQDIRTSDDATLMLTVVIGDKKLGGLFWDSVINSKRDTKRWSPQKELTHDFFRRIRLLANGSTLKLDLQSLKDVVEFYNKNFTRDELGNDYDVLKNVLEPMSQVGNVKSHIVIDESDPVNPTATSAYKNLSQQIISEKAAQSKEWGIIEPEVIDGKMTYPGGLGDTSHMNSVIIVQRDWMQGLRMMTGDYWRKQTVANKPIITFASDGEAAFIGKTMFVVDDNFEPYFAKNDINMVIFSSAVKGIGRDYKDRQIDLGKEGINSIEELLYSDVAAGEARLMDADLHEIALPIESIGIQMWQAEDKPARIPMHVGADLVGRGVNNEYFDWLMGKAVTDYQNKAGEAVGLTDRMIAFSKVLMGDIGSELDNQMYSTIGKMMQYDMYPMFMPWRRTMKNAIMRHFVQQEGVFSPINEFGSQSAAIPSYYAFDHPKGLRNVLFYGENRDIYSYGQGEIGINNRSKGIGKNLSIILHNPSRPDDLVTWGEFVKQARREIGELSRQKKVSATAKQLINMFEGDVENFILNGKRANTLGDVHDFLSAMNNLVKTGASAEVAVLWHRTPSLKSSDKVIVGLKGFVSEGNLARLNTVDFWTRLEGDHDFDKVNYWWDTPTSILNEWKNNAGNIMSITNDSMPTSIEGLSFDNPASLREYTFKSARATKMRGPVVKARRMIQWMKHYQGKDTDVSGYNIVVGPQNQYRISIDKKLADELDELIATDAQRIIDSKDGFTELDFTPDYFKQLLFGNDRWLKDGVPWGGIFKVDIRGRERVKDPKTGKIIEREAWVPASDRVDEMWKDAIVESIKPYQAFLQLATDVYEGGEAKKVDYVTLLEGYETYRDTMKGLNKVVWRRLRKKYGKEQLRQMGSGWSSLKNITDIFGLKDAMFPKPSSRIQINSAGDAINLLPFDRGVWAIASVDRLFMEKPRKNNRRSEDDFDEIWESHIDKDGMTDKVVKDIVDMIRADSRSISILNAVGSKIRRTKSAIDRMNVKNRYFPDSNNAEIITMFKDRLNRLTQVRENIEERILSNRETAGMIRDTIRDNIGLQLLQGNPVKLRRYDLAPDKKSYKLGTMEIVNLKKISFAKRQQWVRKNKARIWANIWVNNQLVPRIRGMDSNEYAQITMWHQTMVDFFGFALDPREFAYAEEFELDVFDMRKFVGKTWGKFITGSDYMPNEREDIVTADLMREMNSRYARWESQQPGLGLLWLFKFMTPVPDMTTVGYHQGKWMPGFKNIDKETKFINLGLNFLNNTNMIPDAAPLKLLGKKADFPASGFLQSADKKGQIFKHIAETFTDKMRVLYGETPVRDFSKMSAEEALRIDFVEPRSDMFDFKIGSQNAEKNFNTEINEVFAQVERTDLADIATLSPEIKKYYSITGADVALDWLNMRGAPIGYDRLYDIRALADFVFKPTKALNSRGKLRSVKDLKSYYGFTKRNAKLFFGELAQTDMLTGTDVPHIDINPFGGRFGPQVDTGEAMKQIWTDKATSIWCG